MIGTVALFLSLAATDPRPLLIEMQMEGRFREALARAEQELAERPEASRRMGLDYLRGHLLDRLGDFQGASLAFGDTMGVSPDLALHARYRLAQDQERMGHPEVAAGLIATVVEKGQGPLLSGAVHLLHRYVAAGGDCRLLGGLRPETLPVPERRRLLVVQADCALQGNLRELARNLLGRLLAESQTDEPARLAAERLAGLVSEAERGRLPLLLGLTFHQNRDFERAQQHLRRAIGKGGALTGRDSFEARYALGRSQFWLGRYGVAAISFGELAGRAPSPEAKARALYQQGRAYELLGQWRPAAVCYRLAYDANPSGEWAPASLLSALRVEWRSGDESSARDVLRLLSSRREWQDTAQRAAIFLATSDISRGRRDRARAWLDQAAGSEPDDRLELAYWRGRLAELNRDWLAAATSYLAALKIDAYHPLSRSALRRLSAEPLHRTALIQGRRLAASSRPEDLYSAWLLLGEDPEGETARRRLRQILLGDRTTAPYLRLSMVPVEQWPLWKHPIDRPEDKLLALGIWREGAPAVRDHFPANGDPALAFTGGVLLARAGELTRSLEQAETMRLRAPGRVPLALQPVEYQKLLYPMPYREALIAQGRIRGVDSSLLAALVRAESRFDSNSLSPASARGLSQLTLPTAKRLATQLAMGRLEAEDLYRPEVSIALGAAHLAELTKSLGSSSGAVAAFNAGEPQTLLWRSYCFSREPEELFSKVSFRETRNYLRRVLTSWAYYQELYRAG